MRMSNCGTCRFWKQTQGKQGECRAAPPQVVLIGVAQNQFTKQSQAVTQAIWPTIMDSEYCGAHEARDAPTSQIDFNKLLPTPRPSSNGSDGAE